MALVWELDLAPNKRLVLLAYADHADEHGNNVYPSLARIAHKTGYSRDQVRRISRELRADELLEMVAAPTATKPAEYRLRLERGSKLPPLQKRAGVASDPSGVGAPTPPEPSIEPSVNNTSKDVEASASPGQFVGYLREELDGADVPLLRNREDRYAGEFNKLISKGLGDELLYKACDRIVERWKGEEHRKLTVEQALEDVVNGKPPKHVQTHGASNGTPQEVISYILEHSRNPVISRYEPIMRKWDFTSSDPPPFNIEKQLGGTDNERWANLNSLQTLAKRGASEKVA